MSSVLNSTSTPLSGNATFTGSSEPVTVYCTISCMVKADLAGTLYIDHGINGSDWDFTDTFSVGAGIALWKQVSVKGSLFRVRFTNSSGSAQSYFRLYSKLVSSAPPDNLNVTLDSNDEVTSILADANGNAVSVVSNKLSVNQNALSNSTDSVLTYGWDGSSNQKLSCNGDGELIVNTALSEGDSSVQVYGYDGSTNRAIKTDTNGKLEVVYSESDQSSYVNSSLQSTPAEVKASAGNVKGIQIYNESAQLRNIRLHDKAFEPVAADTPKLYFQLAGNSGVNIQDLNVSFANKIYVVSSATRGVTGALENVNANEVTVCIQYV